MKKLFVEIELNVVRFGEEDVIATSGDVLFDWEDLDGSLEG